MFAVVRAGMLSALLPTFSLPAFLPPPQLITDRNTRKSKGIAYIEYATQEDVVSAISTLNGQLFMSECVSVIASGLWQVPYSLASLLHM